VTQTKVSTCVGCSTPIIGDRRRRPPCHDEHVGQIATGLPGSDDDVTLPRDRVRRPRRSSTVLAGVVAWVVLGLVDAASGALLLTAARSFR
jgi:hypothetical protein